MKKILFTMLMLLPIMASAQYVEIDGIHYNLIAKGKGAEVTINPNKYTGNVIIPATINYEGTEYNVIKIGNRAFFECFDLTSVSLPSCLTTIGDYSFYNCIGLTSITIPNSLKSIGESAFDDCDGLTSVHISDLIGWCNIDFNDLYSNPLNNFNARHLYLEEEEIKDLVIPNSVTEIGNYVFCGFTGMASLNIHDHVTSIGKGAFYGCSGLTSVTIPNSVTSIGINAFRGCI